MRYLEGEEKEAAIIYSRAAFLEVINSTCEKSKRGVVIVKDNKIIGKGTNNPPGNFECNLKDCYDICRNYTVHAEQNAILDALENNHNLEDSNLYHVKFKDGIPQYSGAPSCVECSKLILQAGIEEIVLEHKDKEFALYSAEEFHLLSLESLKRK
ncbi:MAG: deaminase [Nanoarchaeota archaeon]